MSAAMSLPPGPRFTALQILRFLRDEPRFFQECRARYGDPFTAPLGMGDLVVTGHPDGVRDIFTADPALFEPLGHIPLEPIVGEHSVLLIGGPRHKRERQMLTPPFHGERMRAYSQLMQELALRAASALPPEGLFRAQHLTQNISMEIIIRAVFGVEEPERVHRFRDVLLAYIESYTPPLMMMVPLRRSFGGLGPWARFQRQAARLDALLTEQLALRRGHPSPGTDILSLLLSARDEAGQPMEDAELKDELRTLLIAGYETTSIGMTWALYWTHRLPEVRQRLLEELAPLGPMPDAESLTRLSYLSAVCNEALRLNPVAPLLTRRTLAPFTLRGHALPPGTGVMIVIPSVHSHPELYPEPERFRPERFLERRFSPFEYIPFGGGARRCLGAAFALHEMRIVLGTLLAAHRFALAEQGPVRVVRRNAMHCPQSGVRMRNLRPAQA
jgi:cytochrome P450